MEETNASIVSPAVAVPVMVTVVPLIVAEVITGLALVLLAPLAKTIPVLTLSCREFCVMIIPTAVVPLSCTPFNALYAIVLPEIRAEPVPI